MILAELRITKEDGTVLWVNRWNAMDDFVWHSVAPERDFVDTRGRRLAGFIYRYQADSVRPTTTEGER